MGIEPVTMETIEPSEFEGPYSPNTILRNATLLANGIIHEPETVVFNSEGRMFGFTGDGAVTEILQDGSVKQFLFIGGRPLSGKFDANDDLYIADALKGLLRVKAGSKIVEVLASQSSDGQEIRYCDDLDIASDGKVYFSDATTLAPFRNTDGTWNAMVPSKMEFMRGKPSGRLLVWDPATGDATVLLRDLFFANGVAVAADHSFVLVVETFGLRVHRYWLAGERSGTSEVLIAHLPALPDSISLSEDGASFWLALFTPAPKAALFLAPRPWLRSLVIRMPQQLLPKPVPYGCVLQLRGSDGHVLRTLQDPGGANVGAVTAVTEHQGKLYLGSVTSHFVAVVPAP